MTLAQGGFPPGAVGGGAEHSRPRPLPQAPPPRGGRGAARDGACRGDAHGRWWGARRGDPPPVPHLPRPPSPTPSPSPPPKTSQVSLTNPPPTKHCFINPKKPQHSFGDPPHPPGDRHLSPPYLGVGGYGRASQNSTWGKLRQGAGGPSAGGSRVPQQGWGALGGDPQQDWGSTWGGVLGPSAGSWVPRGG